MKKISEYLSEIDPWGIYLSEKEKETFRLETGQEPCWDEHTHRETYRIMSKRGLGGSLCEPTPEKMCYGYEMAVSLAQKYIKGYYCTKMGRGFAFHEALEALRQGGM